MTPRWLNQITQTRLFASDLLSVLLINGLKVVSLVAGAAAGALKLKFDIDRVVLPLLVVRLRMVHTSTPR